MSLQNSALKLKAVVPLLRQRRWRSISWNHVVVGPPKYRMAFWKKMTFMGTFIVFMFSYPLYVTYMMHEYDLRDGNY